MIIMAILQLTIQQDEKWVEDAKKMLSKIGEKKQSEAKPINDKVSWSCPCHKKKLEIGFEEDNMKTPYYGLYCKEQRHFWIMEYGRLNSGAVIQRFWGPFDDIHKLIIDLASKDEKEQTDSIKRLHEIGRSAIGKLAQVYANLEEKDSKDKEEIKKFKETIEQVIKSIRGDVEKQLKQLDEHIKNLDNNDPKTRDNASKKLIEIGKIAPIEVKSKIDKVLKESKSEEVKARCKTIVEEILKTSENDEEWIKEGTCKSDGLCSKEHLIQPFSMTCERCYREHESSYKTCKICKNCAKELKICQGCQRKLK